MNSTYANNANKVWQEMIKDHSGEWGMDIHHWDWVPGVGVIAMLEYYEATRHSEVMAYLQEWVKLNSEKAKGTKVINSIAPYAIFPALYRATNDEWFRDEAVRVAEWLIKETPRTREDAFEHTVTENVAFAEQVWADTIFMAVLFLARTASLVGNITYAEEALKQVLIHLRVLQDDETNVLFHGWNCASGDHMSAARWTRANAWIAAGIPLIVEEIKQLVVIPDELQERYGRLMSGLLAYQQEDGLWSTVMDQPHFDREVSGSAGIAYGLLKGMEQGLIPRREETAASVERVFTSIFPYITEEGVVNGVSGGTPVMPTIQAYQDDIPTYPTLYGQGLVLMLFAKVLQMEMVKHG
ncbi:glycoside hydrolase family 88 protein [Paenibacillus qinlingensis]|uniref:Unsaturated rhamnogalacturonyl hydrolase n=1 Tax=Paenibacillus qinlingensis TaxID=1837343 RepID=A0ABU1P589_9BACL|nr:glycoside hydrolase family 88 protein [Paenibacillus qinlingensis]MDR6554915.1 unsaturated rhamnogalacturonyl hydrolase [Paenibacillus qinlingensis]